MPAITGVVEAVTFKPIDEDDYGNTFRCSVKMDDGEWYGFGGKKRESLQIKQGKEWVEIEAGDEVEFFYTENGKYRNAKSSKMSLVAKGTGARPSSSSGSSGARAGKAGGADSAGSGNASGKAGGVARGAITGRDLDIKAGRAVNVAASLFTTGKVDSIEAGLREAIRLEVLAEAYYGAIHKQEQDALAKKSKPAAPATPAPVDSGDEDEEEEAPPPPKAKAKAKAKAAPPPPPEPEPEPEAEDDPFDDDIPF